MPDSFSAVAMAVRPRRLPPDAGQPLRSRAPTGEARTPTVPAFRHLSAGEYGKITDMTDRRVPSARQVVRRRPGVLLWFLLDIGVVSGLYLAVLAVIGEMDSAGSWGFLPATAVCGLGEMHLGVARRALQRHDGVPVNTPDPKDPTPVA